MLKLFEIPLQMPEGQRIHPSMGSLFHGALMERFPSELAEVLHRQNVRPYSQSVFFDRARGPLWRIGTLDDVMESALLFGMAEGGEMLHLQQKGYEIQMKEIDCVEETSFEELADTAFTAEQAPHGAELTCLTPTSFKRDGRYALFPESRLIVQSLLQRWNAFCPEIPLEEENLASKLADHAPIVRYDLHTASFSLERQRITGFRGRFALHFGGTDSMRRILALLASFAPFAGIGIKTALGMGAVTSALQYRTSSIGE